MPKTKKSNIVLSRERSLERMLENVLKAIAEGSSLVLAINEYRKEHKVKESIISNLDFLLYVETSQDRKMQLNAARRVSAIILEDELLRAVQDLREGRITASELNSIRQAISLLTEKRDPTTFYKPEKDEERNERIIVVTGERMDKWINQDNKPTIKTIEAEVSENAVSSE